MVGVSGRASVVLIALSTVVACHAVGWNPWPKIRKTREPSPAESLVRLLTDTPLNFDAINNSLGGLCQALSNRIIYQARRDPFWFNDYDICRIYQVGKIIPSLCSVIPYEIDLLKRYLAIDKPIFESYISECERQWEQVCRRSEKNVFYWRNKLRNNLDLVDRR
jgi:hypothetical protein